MNRLSSALTSSSDMSRRYSMEHSPRSSFSVLSITWMRLTLTSARPHLMASSTFAGFAVRTCSQVGNRCLRMANARWELVSVVFCERDRAHQRVEHGLPRDQGASPSGVRGREAPEGTRLHHRLPPAGSRTAGRRSCGASPARPSRPSTSSAVGLARLGKGLPTVPSPASATTSALDSVFGVLGVPFLDGVGNRTVGEDGSTGSGLTVTQAASTSSLTSGSTLDLRGGLRAFGLRSLVLGSFGASSAASRSRRGHRGESNVWREGRVHPQGAVMTQDANRNSVNVDVFMVSRRFSTHKANTHRTPEIYVPKP